MGEGGSLDFGRNILEQSENGRTVRGRAIGFEARNRNGGGYAAIGRVDWNREADQILCDLAIIQRHALFRHLGKFQRKLCRIDNRARGQRNEWPA